MRRIGLVPVGFVMGSAVVQMATVFGGNLLGGGGITGGFGGALATGGAWGGLLDPLRSRGEYAESFPCAHGYAWGSNVEHYGFNAENSLLSDSLLEGYRLVLSRLEKEASDLGAHGVVGIDISYENLVGGVGVATFLATGTAVVHPGSAQLRLSRPFLTNASGQNFERLLDLGYVPVTLALGAGAVYVQPNCLARGDFTVAGSNDQIPNAFGVSRDRARHMLAASAHEEGEGVVHTEWGDVRLAAWGESWNQLAIAFGTVVRRFEPEPRTTLPRPVVPLRP